MRKLEPLFYFFIIKAEKVKPEFNVSFQDEKWAYLNFMSGGQADDFYELLETTNLKKGDDWVTGLWEGAPWSEEFFKPTKNDWVKFTVEDGQCIANFIGG